MHLCACEARVGWQNHRAVIGLAAAGGHGIHRQCRAAQGQVGSVVHADEAHHVVVRVIQGHVGIGHRQIGGAACADG